MHEIKDNTHKLPNDSHDYYFFAYLPHLVRRVIVASMQTQNDINIPRFTKLGWSPLTHLNALTILHAQTEKVHRQYPAERRAGTILFVFQKNNNQRNVVRLTRLHTSCMYGLSGAHMHGTSFGQAEHDHPLISRLCRSCVSLSDLLSQRLSGEHPRNGPQSTPKSISKEPRNKKTQPRNRSQQVAGFAGIFSFGESDGMFDRQQNLKAKWGKHFALPQLRVKPYTQKTDRDDSSFSGLLSVFSRSFAA